jgi:hypothetical protein
MIVLGCFCIILMQLNCDQQKIIHHYNLKATKHDCVIDLFFEEIFANVGWFLTFLKNLGFSYFKSLK